MTLQPVASTEPQAPVVEDLSDFDNQMQEFLGYSFEDKGEDDPVVAAPVAPAAAPETAPATSAEPTAVVQGTVPEEEEIDPTLLASLLLPQDTPAAAPATPAPAREEQPYAPIDASRVNLPDAVVNGIFNSEDPVQQKAALTQLLASWGNAILTLSDQRVAEYHAPKMQERFAAARTEEQAATFARDSFYGEFPDLKPYAQLVARVGGELHKQNPQLSFTPETQKRIGSLTRALAKKMNLPLAGAPAAQPQAVQPFQAGAARPSSAGDLPDPNSAAAMVAELGFSDF